MSKMSPALRKTLERAIRQHEEDSNHHAREAQKIRRELDKADREEAAASTPS